MPNAGWQGAELPLLDCSSEEGISMMALSSKSCSLPRHASFEPLLARPVDVPLSEVGHTFFSEHSSWRVPCDTACAAGRSRGSSGTSDTVHRFVVQRATSQPLNYRLNIMAVSAAAGPTGGVSRSNLGGYQSKADLFVAGEEAESDRLLSSGRVLHGIVSAAMEELTAVSIGREPKPADGPRDAYAWLNVNKQQDSNMMHIHDPAKWSAVYFVSAGGASARAANAGGPLAGRLVFRGARISGTASHSYLAVPPEPGSLWLFSGGIPHCVMPFVPAARGAPGALQPRVSVAINLTDERDKAPRPM